MAHKDNKSKATTPFPAEDWRPERGVIEVRQDLGRGWVALYEVRVVPSGTPVLASVNVEKQWRDSGPEVDSWAEADERLAAIDERGEDEREWLRAEELRRLKTGEALSAAKRLIEETADLGPTVLAEAQRLIEEATGLPFVYSNVYTGIEPHERIKPGKRRKRTELDLAKIAAKIVQAQKRGSLNPADDVAVDLDYVPATVRGLVREARRHDLLLPKDPGHGSRHHRNELTDKARRLLEEQARTGSHVESPS